MHTHTHRLSFALLTKTQAASLGFCLIFPHLMSFFLFLDFWFVVFRFVSGRYVNFALLQRHRARTGCRSERSSSSSSMSCVSVN